MALGEVFLLEIVYQKVVEGMRGLGCAREIGKLVTGQGTPALVIDRVWRGAIDILQVMDRSSRQSSDERAF